jgi:hypothetical protein
LVHKRKLIQMAVQEYLKGWKTALHADLYDNLEKLALRFVENRAPQTSEASALMTFAQMWSAGLRDLFVSKQLEYLMDQLPPPEVEKIVVLPLRKTWVSVSTAKREIRIDREYLNRCL